MTFILTKAPKNSPSMFLKKNQTSRPPRIPLRPFQDLPLQVEVRPFRFQPEGCFLQEFLFRVHRRSSASFPARLSIQKFGPWWWTPAMAGSIPAPSELGERLKKM